MKFHSSILALFLLLAVTSLGTAQHEQRIIRADKLDESDEDETRVLEVTGLKVGERAVVLNESFRANENWLKELKITVKNVGDKDLRCIGIWMGVLEGLDTKLGPYESWGWKINYTNGQCFKHKSKPVRKGESVDLIWYSDPLIFSDPTPWPTFHKAILEWGFVKFKDDKKSRYVRDVRLTLPPDTKFLSDDSH